MLKRADFSVTQFTVVTHEAILLRPYMWSIFIKNLVLLIAKEPEV